MKNIFLLLILLLFSLSSAQTFEWVNISTLDYQFNPTYLHGEVIADNSGNVVSARLLNYQEGYSTVVYGDVKLEKRNPSGILIWEKTIFGKADISEIDVDAENNIICIGTFRDSVVIGNNTLYQSEVNQNSFVFKTDDLGDFLWALDAASFVPQYGVLTALELRSSKNILIGATNYNVSAHIYELDPLGNIVSTILQTDVGTVSDINVDNSENIWVTGFTFDGHVSFNGLDTIAPFIYNEYVVKYSSAGIAQWVNFIEDATVQDFNIETDHSGNAYLSGNLFFGTNFGSLVANGPQWVYDFFVTKISPDGEFLWLQEIPPGNTLGDATIGNSQFLFCSDDGSVYITGFFRGSINFGNGVNLFPLFGNDVFVIKYDTDGEIQWAKVAGSNNFDQGTSITGDMIGNLYVAGFIGENANFDTIFVSGDYRNIFLTKLKSESVVSVENKNLELSNPVSEFTLFQNYPNPFNPTTKIKFNVSSNVYEKMLNVNLKVYDVLGNEIVTLVNEELSPGEYEVDFNTLSMKHIPSSGIYFYTLHAGSFIQTNKMILIK